MMDKFQSDLKYSATERSKSVNDYTNLPLSRHDNRVEGTTVEEFEELLSQVKDAILKGLQQMPMNKVSAIQDINPFN